MLYSFPFQKLNRNVELTNNETIYEDLFKRKIKGIIMKNKKLIWHYVLCIGLIILMFGLFSVSLESIIHYFEIRSADPYSVPIYSEIIDVLIWSFFNPMFYLTRVNVAFYDLMEIVPLFLLLAWSVFTIISAALGLLSKKTGFILMKSHFFILSIICLLELCSVLIGPITLEGWGGFAIFFGTVPASITFVFSFVNFKYYKNIYSNLFCE